MFRVFSKLSCCVYDIQVKLQQYSVPEYIFEFLVSLKAVVAKQKRKINSNLSLGMP